MGVIERAVVFSDLHLGKDEGYLFSPDPNYQSNKKALVELLKAYAPFDEIILNGDILDLAAAGLDAVYSEVRNFFQLVAELEPVKRIVYVPGNHDHHFWRFMGEEIHVTGRVKKGESPPGHGDYPRCFVDRRYSSKDPAHKPHILLTHLWPEDSAGWVPEFVVKYPHHLVRVPQENSGFKNYLITHGHFLESLFKPINYLISPTYLEEIEAFNNLWLEAFDYHLGHAGRLSEKTRELEKRFTQGGKQARRKVQAIFGAVYKNLKKKIDIKFPVSWIIKYALRAIIKKVPMKRTEQSDLRGEHLDEKLLNSIKEYTWKYILQRYLGKNKKELHLPSDKDIPIPFTFIFGHTHEPFNEEEMKKAVVTIKGKSYPLINTGGWLRSDGDGKGNGQCSGVAIIDKKGANWVPMEGKLK